MISLFCRHDARNIISIYYFRFSRRCQFITGFAATGRRARRHARCGYFTYCRPREKARIRARAITYQVPYIERRHDDAEIHLLCYAIFGALDAAARAMMRLMRLFRTLRRHALMRESERARHDAASYFTRWFSRR